MQCEDWWELLSAYADEEIADEEIAKVESHLTVCPECSRSLAFLRSTSVQLYNVPELTPPASLRTAILSATIQRRTLWDRVATLRRALTPAPLFRYGAVAAAGVVAAMTFITLRDGNHGPSLGYNSRNTPRPPQIASVPLFHNPLKQEPGSPPVQNDIREPSHRMQPPIPRNEFLKTQEEWKASGKIQTAQSARPTSIPGRLAPSRLALPSPQPTPNREADIKVVIPPMNPDKPGDDRNTTWSADSEMPTSMAAVPNTAGESAAPPKLPTPHPSGSVHIQIIAASASVNTGQIATLADLKQSLRLQSGDWKTPSHLSGSGVKEIAFDVFKKSF